MSQWSDYPPELNPHASDWWAQVVVNLRKPTPSIPEAVAIHDKAPVGDKKAEGESLGKPEGRS